MSVPETFLKATAHLENGLLSSYRPDLEGLGLPMLPTTAGSEILGFGPQISPNLNVEFQK